MPEPWLRGLPMIAFTYRKTYYYLLRSSINDSLFAFDAGWPCTLLDYARALKTTGFHFERVKWAMVSHFHLDHAGLIRDFQDAGIECLLFENQKNFIDAMERTIEPKYGQYRKIRQNDFRAIETAASRAYLEAIGIRGEVIRTIGHSDDSVSLITDEHEVLIGDLYPISQIMPDDAKSHESWERIRAAGGRHIFPSHAPPFELESE